MTDAPSPFSPTVPGLQIAWDATSLKALMTCPRYYEYSIIKGYRGSSVHTDFGGFFAGSVETYKRSRLSGHDKRVSTLSALRYAIENSWVPGQGPWGGSYEEQWRCTGEAPYRNERGNCAKCPWAHKARINLGPAPDVCGTCGSSIEVERRWFPDDTSKNRETLVRLVAWYCDEQPEGLGDGGLWPYAFGDGTPAVELSWKLPLPWKGPTGERYLLAGHFDSLSTDGRSVYITDNKTTGKALGRAYFAQFSPNLQVDTYDLAGSILYPGLGLRGVVIEGAQVLVGGARFGMHIVYKNEAQRQEFFEELEWWIHQAENYATQGYWPMNRSACYLCGFKKICSMEPEKREMFLAAEYEQRHWNPLQER